MAVPKSKELDLVMFPRKNASDMSQEEAFELVQEIVRALVSYQPEKPYCGKLVVDSADKKALRTKTIISTLVTPPLAFLGMPYLLMLHCLWAFEAEDKMEDILEQVAKGKLRGRFGRLLTHFFLPKKKQLIDDYSAEFGKYEELVMFYNTLAKEAHQSLLHSGVLDVADVDSHWFSEAVRLTTLSPLKHRRLSRKKSSVNAKGELTKDKGGKSGKK